MGSAAIGALGTALTGGLAWIPVGAGVAGGAAACWLDGRYAYIPIGLIFEQRKQPTELWSKTRWVE